MANFWDGSQVGYLQDGRQLDENCTSNNNTELFLTKRSNPKHLLRRYGERGKCLRPFINTMLLLDEALAAVGLRVDDVVLDAQSGYYDHIPIVVDFVIANSPRAVSLSAHDRRWRAVSAVK